MLPKSIPPILYEYSSDPNYLELIHKLEDHIKNSTNEDDFYQTLQIIVRTFMFPKEIWNGIIRMVLNYRSSSTTSTYFPYMSIFQLFYPEESNTFFHNYFRNVVPKKFYFIRRDNTFARWINGHYKDTVARKNDILINDLKFPHRDLDKIWRWYECYETLPPQKKIFETYKEMKKLYEKIKNIKDENIFINAIMEMNFDVEFVKDNIEYKISENFNNKLLWNKYLNFLDQQNDIQTLLLTYSKYCRIFPEDIEMKKRYQNAVLKHIPSGIFDVPWYNIYEFEKYDETLLYKLYAKYRIQLPVEEIEMKPLKVYFNASVNASLHEQQKSFLFKNTLIHYIHKHANAKVQLKLASTCKYFHSKFPSFISHKFIVRDHIKWGGGIIKNIQFYQQSVLFLNYDIEFMEKKIKNIYISNNLTIENKENRKFLSKLIKNIVFCSAKYLSITNQDLTINEFHFLINDGMNIIKLHLYVVQIFDKDEVAKNLEDILVLVPKVEDFRESFLPTTPQTLIKLMDIPFENNLENFSLNSTNIEYIDPDLYLKLMHKIISTESNFGISFLNSHLHRQEINNFNDYISNALDTLWKGKEKPKFKRAHL